MALLPPFFLNTVVAIGVGDDPNKRIWIGTGFLFGKLEKSSLREKEKTYRVWLITNRHVLEDLKAIYVKFNSAVDPDSTDYKVPLIARNGRPLWVGHPDNSTDVAAIFVPVNLLKEEKRLFSFFQSDDHTASRQTMHDIQVTEGDHVFVLGFPMGLVEASRQYVICRGGVLARVRDFLEKRAKDFLVDATVFPGNSGGPVVLCPSAITIKGTKSVSKADLIGVVKSYVPYKDYALSTQTRQPRIIFEENSGLASVESVDSILDTVKLAERRIESRAAQARYKKKKLAATVVTPSTVSQSPAESSPSPPANPARRR